MKIRFLRDCPYSIDGKPVMYRAGEVHDLRQDLAERWKRRDAAVDHVDEPVAPPEPVAPVAAKKVAKS